MNNLETLVAKDNKICPICPYCDGELESDIPLVTCGTCATPHHANCAKSAGEKCTVYSCAGLIPVDDSLLKPSRAKVMVAMGKNGLEKTLYGVVAAGKGLAGTMPAIYHAGINVGKDALEKITAGASAAYQAISSLTWENTKAAVTCVGSELVDVIKSVPAMGKKLVHGGLDFGKGFVETFLACNGLAGYRLSRGKDVFLNDYRDQPLTLLGGVAAGLVEAVGSVCLTIYLSQNFHLPSELQGVLLDGFLTTNLLGYTLGKIVNVYEATEKQLSLPVDPVVEEMKLLPEKAELKEVLLEEKEVIPYE